MRAEHCAASAVGRTRAWSAAIALVVAGLCVGAAASQGGDTAKPCDHCLGINDTTSSGGDINAPRFLRPRAARPPIVFVGADSAVHCAVPTATGWAIETVDPMRGGGGCAIELDDFHEPWITYHDAGGTLFWARKLGTAWLRTPIDPSSVVRGSTSLARVPAGLAIAYVDAGAGVLKFAEQDPGGVWHIENVAQVFASEAHPSLLADGNARVISYRDALHHDLRLAVRLAGGGWTSQILDATSDAGGYSSLVGQPVLGALGVAYYDFTQRVLRYAHGMIGGGWTIETVDGAGDVGRFCSAFAFAGTPDDRVGIAYYDVGRGDLKYAEKLGGTWTISVLDSAGDVGRQARCGGTPMPDDSLGVAYAESGTGNLKYLLRTRDVTAVPAPDASRAALHVWWARSRNGGGTVRFDVREPGAVRVSILDVQGRLLATPFARSLPAGAAEVPWDGRDRLGAAVPSGVYVVRVDVAGDRASTCAQVVR